MQNVVTKVKCLVLTVCTTGGTCLPANVAKPPIDVSPINGFLLDAGNMAVVDKRFACLHAYRSLTVCEKFRSIFVDWWLVVYSVNINNK